MDEDLEYKKLPVEERCIHKLWKARVDGYDEAAKIFRSINDEKSPEWNKFQGLIKKFVVDSNAVAQEKGLDAALIFVENCGNAGKTVGDIIAGIVAKSIAAPKAKTKDLSVQIALMCIEIEKHEIVLEELLKGTEQKNPKIVSACVTTITQALREFGNKVINIKSIVKKLPILLSDRDKGVRDETKVLTIEIYRWIGPAFKSQISSVPSVLLTELEAEFEKIGNSKPMATRYLRSQQEKQMLAAVAQEAEDCGDFVAEANEDEEVDPLAFVDPVDILSKLPKDFYEKIEAKKWQDRKEVLDVLEPLSQNPKLQSGDYGDLVKALKKIISKDTNVVLVALGGKCLAGIARGLGKKFQPYAGACVSAILEKFKEKKTNVVSALRDAIDAIYLSTNLDAISEDILEALANKNPNVKMETALFLARAFSKTLPTVLNKKLLKAFTAALLKTLNESDPNVRDASADAIGTAMKLVGEKAISPYLTEVDALKMAKVKESFEKAVITVKITGIKKERPATAPAAAMKGGSIEPKPVARPATAANSKKAPANKSKPPTSGVLKSSSASTVKQSGERDLSQEEIDEKASEILSADILQGLIDSNWKARLSSMENFLSCICDIENNAGYSQILIRTVSKKPGLKDTNFQVLKLRLDCIKVIVDKFGITTTTAEYIIVDVVDKLGDSKNSSSAAILLTSIADTIGLEYVVSKVMNFAFEQKSPKVQIESLTWVNNAIKEFGFKVNTKLLLEDAKKAVQSINPTVRGACIQLLGTMYLFMGNNLKLFFENEKPALKQQIFAEFEKLANQKAPTPTRGISKCSSNASFDDNLDNDDENDVGNNVKVNDFLPRVDISSQISESLLAEINDKNWKTRNEGLVRLQNILSEAKIIKPSLGDLPQTLFQRLIDSNAKIAQTAVEICQQIAIAMGPPFKQYIRVLFPGILKGLGDSKAFIRTACITCINVWGEQSGHKEFFESEMIPDALKSGSPSLRTELWGWLAEKLPLIPSKTIQKDELIACLPHLYSNICDRNADVRKNANEAVLGIMIHLGYDAMTKALDKQKPTSKKDIQAALDKARPNLPVKPLPKNKQQAPIEEPKPVSVRPNSAKPKQTAATKQPAVARKKEEEVDVSPLLAENNMKNQRLLDEQKLKVLKWTFTQPREEFTDLLKEQMTSANVNKGLIANMFHDDFRYHLKVIDALIEDLPNNDKALICNLDLVMKWLSLRFYDTNPSVLLRGLDYLNLIFQMLIDNQYSLAENEGNSFVPHLLTKFGDPKDVVRNGVRTLLRQICFVYPFAKVFVFIMDALKSKNARQRAECLDELGYLIDTYGLSACQPSQQHALKEIAKHISDRDNSVRNAALNAVVQAYFLAGEKIYKLIGQLSEKDLSMLDERIKRSKRVIKKPANSNIEISNVNNTTIEISSNSNTESTPEKESPQQEEIQPVEIEPTPPEIILPRKPSGPFKLDPDVIADIERGWIKTDQMKQRPKKQFDFAFLESPIKVIPVNGVAYPADKFNSLLLKAQAKTDVMNSNNYNMSPPQINTNTYTRRSTEDTNLADSLPKLDPNLVRTIRGIGSADIYGAHASIISLSEILESPEKQVILRDYEEIYIQSILQQFKNLSQKPISESLPMYQPVLHSIYSFFGSKCLGKKLSVNSIKNIMSVLLGLMADNKLGNTDDSQQYTKVVNGICLKILDRTNFTHLNCALIRLLKETCSSSCLPKFTDLLMKCIWRNVKVMPDRVAELDYDLVLLEVHEFMIALPSTWWQSRVSDTPLRTVKTIIHNMTKIKGNGILQHLNKIPTHSELNSYILRILKNINKESATQSGNIDTSPHQQQQYHKSNSYFNNAQQQHISRDAREIISNIFRIISDKETSREGLRRLHEFKLTHPEVDINPFLKGASPSFQKFIVDGLASIETNNMHINEAPSLNVYGTQPNLNPDYWMEKLQSLKAKANITSSDQFELKYTDNRIADENLNMNQIQSNILTPRKDDSITSNRLELLQQKLEQFKHKTNP
uniref:Putative microtubule-associated protein n=1 Tax=Corethrella appendiculata TaxID=1370023 RepID=W4VRR1_9DIPT